MKTLKYEFVHEDKRRKLTQLITSDIKQINLYETIKGSLLGNHFHKITHEYFLILKGSFLLDVDGKSQIVHRKDFFLIEPHEKHILECLSPTGSFLTFVDKPYSKEESDTYK